MHGEGGAPSGAADILIGFPILETPIVNDRVPLRFDEAIAELLAIQSVCIFLQKLQDLISLKDFEIPSGILFRDVDPETGELATDRCPETVREVFTEKTVPTEKCHKHR